CIVIFFMPAMGGYFLERRNFEEDNNLKTTDHIAPGRYYTPSYSMLRAMTAPLFGFDSKMLLALVMLLHIPNTAVLPWLDRSPVRSMRYKGWYSRIGLLLFVASFIILGVLGTMIATGPRTALAQVCTAYYFLYFLAMPWYTSREKTTQPPARVTGRFITIPQLLLSLVGLGVLVFVPLKAVGAASHANLEHFSVDLENKAGLQSGATTFANFCMGCHGAQYSRYNRVGRDLGIP